MELTHVVARKVECDCEVDMLLYNKLDPRVSEPIPYLII